MAEKFDLLAAQRAVFRSGLGRIEKLVALALLDHWSLKSTEPFPSVARLARLTSCTRRTVMRALRDLELAGAIQVHRRTGQSSTYDISPLATLPEAAPDRCQDCTGDTIAPVSGLPPTGDRNSPPPVSGLPPKEPIEGTKGRNPSSAARATGKARTHSKAKKGQEEPNPLAHVLSVHYVAEMKRHRGVDVKFRSWSRAMKAFGDIGNVCGEADGKRAISTATADPYTKRIQPWEIADDLNKHLGKVPQPAGRNGSGPKQPNSGYRPQVIRGAVQPSHGVTGLENADRTRW